MRVAEPDSPGLDIGNAVAPRDGTLLQWQISVLATPNVKGITRFQAKSLPGILTVEDDQEQRHTEPLRSARDPHLLPFYAATPTDVSAWQKRPPETYNLNPLRMDLYGRGCHATDRDHQPEGWSW